MVASRQGRDGDLDRRSRHVGPSRPKPRTRGGGAGQGSSSCGRRPQRSIQICEQHVGGPQDALPQRKRQRSPYTAASVPAHARPDSLRSQFLDSHTGLSEIDNCRCHPGTLSAVPLAGTLTADSKRTSNVGPARALRDQFVHLPVHLALEFELLQPEFTQPDQARGASHGTDRTGGCRGAARNGNTRS